MTASSPPTPNDETTAGYVLAVSAQGPREESGGSAFPEPEYRQLIGSETP